MMNPEIKTRWVAALRSGEFKQGRGVLRRGGEEGGVNYCCLGVLCDLARQDGLGTWDLDNYFVPVGESGLLSGQRSYPPEKVEKWAGLSERNPTVNMNGEIFTLALTTTLSVLNDSGSSFAEIADLIERQL